MFLIRAVVVLTPLITAFLMVRLVSGYIYRPPGWVGVVLWIGQSAIVGSATSIVVDRFTRHLLPLATLFSMSLVFPDQAPSRLSVALRSGTTTRLRRSFEEVETNGLGSSEAEAAETAVALIAAIGHHDRLTRGHTERVRAYAELIAKEMGISPDERVALSWSVLLHDVGKLAIPVEILNKNGLPSDEEWEILKTHPTRSAQILAPLASWLGPWVGAASEHHERWDGGGYPRGLAGVEISLAGRITAVADAYDVITAKRSYKEPLSTVAARRELVANAGSQFDPAVVRAFLNVSLGRRWMIGPFAWLADLPIGQLVTTASTAPVIVTVGAAAAMASVVGAPLPDPDPGPDFLAFVESVEPAAASTTEPADLIVEQTPKPTSSAQVEVDSTIEATTSLTIATTTTTTVAPSSTTTVSIAPTTTTPPTTSAPTEPSTTTTTIPPATGTVYLLRNPSSGDTTARLLKTLVGGAPDDATQPNFDTDRDAIPGLSLAPTSSSPMWDENSVFKIQRFGLEPTQSLSGPARLTIYLAAETEPAASPVTVRVALSECNWQYKGCSNLAESAFAVTSSLLDDFQPYVIDLGSVSHSFSPNRRLVVRFIAEGGQTVHTAFDSIPYPSSLEVTWQ
ncbi:MAG: HD-GYP domain-containing protein [Actinomycetia bacterium]|nr:HD-GYP domain-containing protein [Actinomycetes bacterium]